MWKKYGEMNDRLKKFLDVEGMSVRQFESLIGSSDGKIAKFLTTNSSLKSDTLNSIMEKFPQLSIEWLLTGKGSMLKDQQPEVATAPAQLEAAPRRRIPLYADISSIGGLNDRVANVEHHNAHVAEWIDAGDWFPEATAAIRHYGDSMLEYPAGSILVLKRVLDMRLLINGRNYVIETSEFRITKQLQHDDGTDYIMAYSTNRETYPDGRLVHAPIRIPLETVRHIDLVVGCVQKEFSNGAIPII